MKTEEFKVNGEDVVRMVKKLIKEGNVRRISIKNEEGKSLIEFPLTIGVVGAILLPTLAAVGAVAALLAKCTIVVERDEAPVEPSTTTSPEQSV
jgi:hypothetical protein